MYLDYMLTKFHSFYPKFKSCRAHLMVQNLSLDSGVENRIYVGINSIFFKKKLHVHHPQTWHNQFRELYLVNTIWMWSHQTVCDSILVSCMLLHVISNRNLNIQLQIACIQGPRPRCRWWKCQKWEFKCFLNFKSGKRVWTLLPISNPELEYK